ncbi:AAA family ATPase [Streptomyces sp. 1331.2]|uniref:AAA family ATPase n=1 Tax=Streptomyces sp. 1331.2 TaxID=1938835 RepID=UPI000BCF9B4A|nr:AAA family ATPase [Streptomyces sp. 1331.2]SOB85128.1 AAA ATPase domain-containing protein [Streptomyces sp. 1331.2]
MDDYEVSNEVSGTVYGNVIQGGSITVQQQPRVPIPHQVRPPRESFVNREPELAALVGALERAAAGRPGIVVFTGLGGVGKTELIARFARDYRSRFPDGDLYADFQAYRHQGGVDLSEIVAGFLRALGTEAPPVEAERFTKFRTVTAERRCLFFLDNVEHAAEVRALLPSSGLVVVASRRRLPALRTDGAEVRQLGPLSLTAGSDLVRAWLGAERGTDRELAELVEMCGGLPLALNAIGSRLLDRDRLAVGRVVAELHDREGKSVILDSEEGNLRPTYDLVYERLPPEGRALYHLIGVHPGPFVSAELARAVGVERAVAALDELRAVHLLDDVVDDDPEERFRAHDVVRLHAHDRARELPDRARLLARVVAYFRGRASLADRAMGTRVRLQEPSGEDLPGFASYPEALEWLQAERANLRAVVEAAAEEQWHGEVWRLCESLWPLYHNRKHYQDLIATHRLGVESAQWDNQPNAVVRLRNQLARAHYERKEYGLAAEQLARATELVPLVTNRIVVGVLYETDGLLCLADGRTGQAVERFTLALEENRGDDHGEIVQRYHLAQALTADGRPEQALLVLAEAAARAEATEDHDMVMKLPLVRARAHRALGRLDLAVEDAGACVRKAEELKQYAKEGQAHTLLVALAEELGDEDLAERSRARLRELGL